MALTIEAVVQKGSEVVSKSVKDINEQYGVIVLSNQRQKNSEIERVNPNPKRVIDANDRLEFRGDSESVMNLFRKCENP